MAWLTKGQVDKWNNGTFYEAYKKLGAHPNSRGTRFAVWAPHAESVSVIGSFNNWAPGATPLARDDRTGIWETYARGAKDGAAYKYHVTRGRFVSDKADPWGYAMEGPAEGGHDVHGLSSIVNGLDYQWSDSDWMANRLGPGTLDQPISIYEIHLGSWRHSAPGASLSYREIAEPLADYVSGLGFTHVEFLPVMEHPYYGSWGYQVTGFFAPTHRYGSPQDLMFLIDTLHQRGVGVIVDWVPAHFATDPQGLVFFDGQPLYEYEDPVMRHHPDWGTYVFDYGKPGVRNFLISNANFWFDRYHVDGLRTDAVASMLYRDYSRSNWTPNQYGGRENLEAISFMQELNASVYARHPEVQMIAEESTAWPGVTSPTHANGLGFLYKWNMGWMHDTLKYMEEDPLYRSHHHDTLTFPLIYAFSEQYILPLSHDEVVHLKGSLWNKMPGDEWQKAANLRLLLAHQIGHPGKKLLFMGGEFGQLGEWNADTELDWSLLSNRLHGGVQLWVKELMHLYRDGPSLWSDRPEHFEWLDYSDRSASVIAYQRSPSGGDSGEGVARTVFVFNFTPVVRSDYALPLPSGGPWTCVLNSDDSRFGGSGLHDIGKVDPHRRDEPTDQGHLWEASLKLPPLAAVVLTTE